MSNEAANDLCRTDTTGEEIIEEIIEESMDVDNNDPPPIPGVFPLVLMFMLTCWCEDKKH